MAPLVPAIPDSNTAFLNTNSAGVDCAFAAIENAEKRNRTAAAILTTDEENNTFTLGLGYKSFIK